MTLVSTSPELVSEAPSEARQLFFLLADLPAGDLRRDRTREQLIRMHLPMVRFLASRYRGRGEPYEDLVQAGAVGLVKAVDRFDVERGLEFSTYAVPTVLGEIRRHFRDRTWSVHVYRRLQEMVARVSQASAELSQELNRAPTVPELAARVGAPQERVLEALDCARSYSAQSLEAPHGDGEGVTLTETLGGDDPALTDLVLHESLGPALARLPERERRILQLRFYGNQTQSRIAGQLGISQMQVSRLLARSLARLREDLGDD